MAENNDTTPEAVTSNTNPGATGSTSAAAPAMQEMAPVPIFESFIYDFVPPGSMGGDGTGKPGTIGGPIGGQDPKYRVLTYPFLPPPVPIIDNIDNH
jgi:hypothetical protein